MQMRIFEYYLHRGDPRCIDYMSVSREPYSQLTRKLKHLQKMFMFIIQILAGFKAHNVDFLFLIYSASYRRNRLCQMSVV